MGTSRLRRHRKRTAARPAALRRALFCFAALTTACATAPVPPATIEGLRSAPLEAGTLRVQLVFDATADLDLYVTDPALETVYYANTPSRLGGALEADRRCDAQAPRIETVDFEAAPAGIYRVGVDFPERCGRADRVPFTLVIRGPGIDRIEKGEVAFGTFQPKVLELELRR